MREERRRAPAWTVSLVVSCRPGAAGQGPYGSDRQARAGGPRCGGRVCGTGRAGRAREGARPRTRMKAKASASRIGSAPPSVLLAIAENAHEPSFAVWPTALPGLSGMTSCVVLCTPPASEQTEIVTTEEASRETM